MTFTASDAAISDAERLAAGGLTWLLGQARDTPEGVVWTESPDQDEVDPTLYAGAAAWQSGGRT